MRLQESDTTEVTEHTHTGRNECSWEFWNYWEAFQDTFSDFFLKFAFSGLFNCSAESPEWIILISQPQISKHPPIKVQCWEKVFASQNPRPTSQLVSKMPSLLVRSLHPFPCYTHLHPNSGSQSWIPGTEKQAQARHLSTQHLKFSNKQDGFKEQTKQIPNQWPASCTIWGSPSSQGIACFLR